MKTTFRSLFLIALFAVTFILNRNARAAGTTVWNGSDLANLNTNWSDTANWSPGAGASNPPGTADTVVFGALSSGGVGVVDSIVDANTTISSLLYTNVGGGHNALIPSNVTLTVNGLVSVGFAGQTTPDAMSGPGNFTVNNVGSALNIGGSGGSTETATLTLADGTNTINVSKLSIGESAGSNGRLCTLNLGNGVNVINVDNINLGTGKAQGTIQFTAAATNGSVKIRNTAGTGRSAIILGNDSSSGSATCNGKLLLAGHSADVLASTLHIPGPESAAGTGGSLATVTMDHGTLDVTEIRMGENSPGTNTHPTCVGIFTFGGDSTNIATLIVNSPSGPGGGHFFVSDAPGGWFDDNGLPKTTLTGNGTFNLNTNGIAQVYCSILKVAATSNTAAINITGGILNMEAATNTIGIPAAPIDNVTLDFATLDFAEDGSSLNLAAGNLTLNDTNVVNIASLPPITHLPTFIPIMTYTALNSAVNLGVGTLPGGYSGFITNDGVDTISLVITNGTIVVAKQDEWLGGVNNNWDVTTLNWTNAGASVTNYTEADFVTFSDKGTTGNVTLLGSQHTPSGVTVTNNALSYTLSGAGRISGISSLVKYGSASLTLAETGGDNFSGGIAVHGGSIILDDPNSNISGGLTNDAGTVVQFGNNDANGVLPLGGLDNEGTLVFKRTDNVLLATVISGGGGLVQGGSGTLNSSVVNTYTGNTTVTNGTLTLSGPGSIASPLATVNSATLDVSSSDGSGSHFNTVALTNATFNVSNVLTTVTSLRTTNSTINLVADANITVGGQADISATGLITAGAANTIKVSSIQNLVLSPTLPIIMPLISYSSATFAGGFNFGLIPPLGVSGYISNDVANSSVDLVITNAPQSITWNGGSSTGNNWTDAANWGGTPIGALDALTFDGVNRLNNTNDTAAGTLYTNITFNSGAGIFTLNGNPINFRGTMLNNSSSTQAVNLGFTLNAACSFDGGTAGGALAVSGGVTNISATSQTVTLLDVGTMKDLWATNAGANGGGQLQFLLGTAGGDWTILDGTGTGGLVSPGNVQFTLSAGAPGGAIDFGTVSSAPNVDVGAGFVSIASPATGNSNAFNINNGKLKANGMVLPASGAGYLNMNGGTLILGTNSFTGGGGAGGGLVVANINGGSIYSTNGGIFQVTARCPAAFNINGGLVQCGTFEISAGTASSGNGTNYLNGGTLICTNITCGLFAGNASSTMYFNGGTLKAGTNSANFITKNNLAPLTLNVSTNGAVIDTTNFSETISLPLIHDANLDLSQVTQDGGLIKLGVGTLTLSAVNTYTGSNTVSGGTLLVSGSVLGDAIVGVAGTLAGTGTVGGQVTVNGTLAPGTPAATGVLTVSSNVTINASGTNIMKLKKGSLTNDVLSVAQTLTYGGTLNLTNISGTLAANDSFKLFNAGTYAGAFTSIFPATPGAGLAWNTNNLTLNGTLSITSVGPITNANITQVTLVGTNVVIHGTNNNVPNSSFHYVVLTSTNLTLPLSNWTPVITNSFNGSGTFDYTNPIVPGQPKLFYDVQAVP